MSLYGIAHTVRDRMGWLWDIIEMVNSWLFFLRYGRLLKGFSFTTIPDGYEVVVLRDVPTETLVAFFNRQPEEAYTFFKPHGFDAKSIKKLQKNRAFLAYVLMDKGTGQIAGYLRQHGMTVCKQTEDVHTNLLFQMLCHRFMTERDFDAHVKSIRDLYRRKCGIMLDAMEFCFPADVTYTRPEGGLFVWCTLPDKIDLLAFVKAAMERKVAVVPGTAFATDTQTYTAHSFRVTYATPTDEQLAQGVAILGDLAREMMK